MLPVETYLKTPQAEEKTVEECLLFVAHNQKTYPSLSSSKLSNPWGHTVEDCLLPFYQKVQPFLPNLINFLNIHFVVGSWHLKNSVALLVVLVDCFFLVEGVC